MSLGTIGTLSNFQRRNYEAFYWKIEQFSTRLTAENYYYCSPNFPSENFNGYMRFYPNSTGHNKTGFIGLSFCSPYNCEVSSLRLSLGFKTRNGRVEKWFSSYIYLPERNAFGSPALILRSEFLKRKEELAPSDCLTLVALLSTDAVEVMRDNGDQNETGHEEEKEDEEKKGAEKALGDMAKLLRSGDKSDATIVVEEAEYKVHSCILAARTPVFAALFEHDTAEKATRKITITDCEPAVFQEFLHYIYTGSVRNLTAENSFGIYRTADKYLVKDLKEVCRGCIQDNLCSETFCEAVRLALRCGDEDLLQSAIDYCAENFRHIIRSVEWQQYIKEDPIEANEILIKSCGPP